MASHEADGSNHKDTGVGHIGRSRTLSRPGFYKSPPRWHFFAALIGAIALEASAVAFASLHKGEEIPIETGISQELPAAEVILTDLPPEPSPPLDAEPPQPPLPPTDPTKFVLEDPTPPPRLQKARKLTPRVASLDVSDAVSRSGNYVSRSAIMISSPHPSYPYEARRTRQTGSGKFLIKFNPSGRVTGVRAIQSTGSAILDQVSLSALLRWRCKPGAYEQIYVPVTFTLQGAQL
jgi:TonB family protein